MNAVDTIASAPATMTTRAVVLEHFGPPEVLVLQDVAAPALRRDEMRVRVEAAGVNFRDLLSRRGVCSSTPPPARMGVEGAGTIVEIGEHVTEFAVGDRVAWTNVDGSYAEIVSVREQDVVPIPPDVSIEAAGALLSQGLTAHYLTTAAYRVAPGDQVLVLAAAGGVGRMVAEIAVSLGADVLGVVSQPSKVAEVLGTGAQCVVGYEGLLSKVSDFTSHRGASVVYDGVGGPRFPDSIAAVGRRGTVVLFGTAGGEPPLIDVNELAAAGSVTLIRPRLMDFIADRGQLLARSRELFDWYTQGRVQLRIAARFPLREAAAAHRAVESRALSGKILLHP